MNKKVVSSVLLAALLLAGCGAENTDPVTSLPAVTESAPSAPAATEPVSVTEPESRIDLADGLYTVDFVTDSGMFKANEANDGKGILTVENGQAVLHVSLTSKNIVNLYLGTAAEAAEDEAGWLHPTVDKVTYSDGLTDEVNGFDVPVPCVGEDFDLALIGKKGVWYDHKVSVQNPAPIADGADVLVDGADALADGTYTCEVTLTGGSGRATVESPAKLTVQDGVITAEILWSSPNYEYMLVGEVRYEPVQTEGNAAFEIPVTLDTDMAVSACTIAMSEPHLIDYVLHFDSATIQKA